jgi:hypothetical protein
MSEQRTENEIIGSALRDMIDAGYTVKTEDHDGSLWFAVLDEEISTEEAIGFIRLVWGNGADMLSDYSTNLEDVLQSTIKLSD